MDENQSYYLGRVEKNTIVLKQNSNRAFGTLITNEDHDCNNLGFGIFLLFNPKNGVAEINWHVIISANNNGAQTGFQITYDLTDGSKAYTRTQASGIWSDWVFIK